MNKKPHLKSTMHIALHRRSNRKQSKNYQWQVLKNQKSRYTFMKDHLSNHTPTVTKIDKSQLEKLYHLSVKILKKTARKNKATQAGLLGSQ